MSIELISSAHTCHVVFNPDGIWGIGFLLEVNAQPPPERTCTMWYPTLVGPHPSRGVECPICTELTSGEAFEFPCGHACCWSCAKQWAVACSEGFTCPCCRNDEVGTGLYFTEERHVDVLRCETYTFLLGCAHPQGKMDPAVIELVHVPGEDWWNSLYAEEKHRDLIRRALSSIRRHHQPAVTRMMQITRRRCQWCGSLENLLQCTRCKRSAYCSKACQKKDWKTHRHQCSQ